MPGEGARLPTWERATPRAAGQARALAEEALRLPRSSLIRDYMARDRAVGLWMRQLDACRRVSALVEAGESKRMAVDTVAKDAGVGVRTLWGWLAFIEPAANDEHWPHQEST